ncbi:MAG: hypothetical protein O2992_01770 [Gemmatimonadetes bacterium]|nr:hypothetical protein [Gemmatimonadota bacterium]
MWHADLSVFDGEAHTRLSHAGSPPLVRHLSVLVGAIAVVVAVPILTLLPASSVGPVIAMVGIPNFSQAQTRAARVEAFRPYRVAFDESVTPQDAGILLQILIYVGVR